MIRTDPGTEIRSAASKLREKAQGAILTGDRWVVDVRGPLCDLVWLGTSHDVVTATWRQAAWVGLMSPFLAAWLEREADRWDAEITRDTPECPACDTSINYCQHQEEDFHDGGRSGSGCDRVYGALIDPCSCWDHPLVLARMINES